VNDLNKALSQEGVMVIDVRTMEEFKRSHIPGVINIPTEVVHDHEDLFKKQHVHVICNSGNRSAMVIRDMISKGIDNLTNVEGGMVSWVKSRLHISGKSKPVMPMMRQVMIVVGLMILSGVALHFLVSPKVIYLSGFVGLGLFYAGVSGHCYMKKCWECFLGITHDRFCFSDGYGHGVGIIGRRRIHFNRSHIGLFI
tara:strand:- start:23540 stop:24130 length:591 start_codon:yes stop_codon:yes gene_type:complete